MFANLGWNRKIKCRRLRAIKLNCKNKFRKIFKNMAKRKHLCRKIKCTYAETASKFNYIRNFQFIKILSYIHFQIVRILVYHFPQQPYILEQGASFFIFFSVDKKAKPQNRKNLCRKIFDKASIRNYLCCKIHFFRTLISKHLCRILLYPH